MLKNKSIHFESKPQLILLIGASILVFLAGSTLVMTCFGIAFIIFLGKGKIEKAFNRFFDELFVSW